MVDQTTAPEHAETDDRDTAEAADPTLDIVRQLIDEAGVIEPPVAPSGAGPTGDAGAEKTGGEGSGTGGVTATGEGASAVQAERLGDAADPDDWDDPEAIDFMVEGGVRRYGIIDPETGETVATVGGAPERGSAPIARKRRAWLARWTALVLCAAARVAWRGLRYIGRLVRRGAAALWARLLRFLARPDAPRRLAIGLLLVFVILWPGKVFGLTLLVPLGLLILWSSVGSSGCRELIVLWHRRLKARDPDKAERIRLRAKAVSRALGRGLDRLPKRWTQGIYLPDFEPEGYVPEKLKVDPFEDFAAKVYSAKHAGDG